MSFRNKFIGHSNHRTFLFLSQFMLALIYRANIRREKFDGNWEIALVDRHVGSGGKLDLKVFEHVNLGM